MAAKSIGVLVYTDTDSSLATTTLVSSESLDDYHIEVTVLPSSGMSKAVYDLPADAVEISDLFPELLFSPITTPDTVFLTDTTIPTQAQTQPNPSDGGWSMSKGAVVGIVLGVAGAMAALTLFFTVLYMRHRRRRRRRSNPLADNPTKYTGLPSYRWDEIEKYTALAELDGSPRLTELDAHPSRPVDDNLIRSKTQSFLVGVEAYVAKFFAEGKNHKILGSRNALKGFDSPLLPKALPLLLDQSKRCTTLITHALTHFIIARIQIASERHESLLPPDFFLAQTVVDRCERSNPEFALSHSQWRVLTVHLRPDAASKPTYIAHRNFFISQLCTRILDAFSPWLLSPRSYPDPKNAQASDPACESTGRSTPVRRVEEDERVAELAALFKEGADLGIFLFAQPSLLEFCWPEVGKGEVVVLPALEKVQDERGMRLDVPTRLVEAKLRVMDKPME